MMQVTFIVLNMIGKFAKLNEDMGEFQLNLVAHKKIMENNLLWKDIIDDMYQYVL